MIAAGMFLRELGKVREEKDYLQKAIDASIDASLPEGAIAIKQDDGSVRIFMLHDTEGKYGTMRWGTKEEEEEIFSGKIDSIKVLELSDDMKDVRYTMGAIQSALVDMEDTQRCPCERIKRHLQELPVTIQKSVDDVFTISTDKNTYDILWYRGRYGWKHIVQNANAPKTHVLLCLRYAYH